MPPKKDTKGGKGDKGGKTQKTQKSQKPTSSSGGKAKKKKWSKGKVRDKLNNMCLFDQLTYDRLYKEVPGYKLITPSIVSERLKVRISLARHGLQELCNKGFIRLVSSHNLQMIYARTEKAE